MTGYFQNVALKLITPILISVKKLYKVFSPLSQLSTGLANNTKSYVQSVSLTVTQGLFNVLIPIFVRHSESWEEFQCPFHRNLDGDIADLQGWLQIQPQDLQMEAHSITLNYIVGSVIQPTSHILNTDFLASTFISGSLHVLEYPVFHSFKQF